LDASKFKSGGLYDPWRRIIAANEKVGLNNILWRLGLGWSFNLQAISSSGRRRGECPTSCPEEAYSE
jgi:hypothetical protein